MREYIVHTASSYSELHREWAGETLLSLATDGYGIYRGNVHPVEPVAMLNAPLSTISRGDLRSLVRQKLGLHPDVEITLEPMPGYRLGGEGDSAHANEWLVKVGSPEVTLGDE